MAWNPFARRSTPEEALTAAATIVAKPRGPLMKTDESWQRGGGVPPFDQTIEATLTADGAQTILVIETHGMPLDKIAFYGAGWQIHAENLATYLAGREPGDTEARWAELVPPYLERATSTG